MLAWWWAQRVGRAYHLLHGRGKVVCASIRIQIPAVHLAAFPPLLSLAPCLILIITHLPLIILFLSHSVHPPLTLSLYSLHSRAYPPSPLPTPGQLTAYSASTIMPITITTPCKPGEKTPSVTYSQRKFQPPVYTPSKNTRSPTVLSSQSSLESSLPSSLESLQRPGSYSRNNPTPSPQSVGTPAASQEAEEDIINDLDDDLDDLHVDYPVTGGPSWPPQTPVRRSIASPAPERGTAPRRRDEDDDDVGEDLDFLTRLMKQHQAMKGLTTPPPARRSVVASSRPPSVAPSTSSFRTPFSRNSMPPPLLPPPSSVLRTPLPRATPRAETPLDIDANLDNLVTPLPTT